MADEIVEVDEPQVPTVEDDSFEIEIVQEGAPEDATLELEAKLAEQAQVIEQLKAQAPQQTDQSAVLLEALKELRQPTAPPEETPRQEPQIDMAGLREQINKDFFNDPAGNTLNLVTPVLQQMQVQTQEALASKSMQISRLMVMADESSKGLMGKYGTEVEQYVKADTVKDDNVYQRALNKVKMEHFDELLQEQVEAKLATALESATQTVAAKQMPFSNATLPPSGAPPESGGKKKIRITPAQSRRIDQIAATKGLTRQTVIDYFVDKGEL